MWLKASEVSVSGHFAARDVMVAPAVGRSVPLREAGRERRVGSSYLPQSTAHAWPPQLEVAIRPLAPLAGAKPERTGLGGHFQSRAESQGEGKGMSREGRSDPGTHCSPLQTWGLDSVKFCHLVIEPTLGKHLRRAVRP